MKNILISFFILLNLPFAGAQEVEGASPGQFSLRTNLASLAVLAPSLGLEYQFNNKLAVMLDGSFAYWNFETETRNKYWRLIHISPKVRQYVNPSRNAYLALQFDIGAYNIAQEIGKFKGGGIAFGKQYYLTKNTWIDLGLTLGYLHFSDRKKYDEINDTYYLQEDKGRKNYWGPSQVSINIIRKLNVLTRSH